MFQFRLDGSSGVSPYLQLVHQVRRSLLLGYLRAGDRHSTVLVAAGPGAAAAGYFTTEIPFIITTLAVGPNIFAVTKTVSCTGALCLTANTNTTPPVRMQFLAGGSYLAFAVASTIAAAWLFHRRTT